MGADQTTKSLGEFLRQERQKHGVTLEQIASATKINVKTLHSLESDQYQDLPAKPFIRGFVISYARFIGLDPKRVLSEFSSYIDERQKERPNREGGHSGYAFDKREGEQTRTLLWIVMGGFIVLGSIIILFLKPSLHHHKEKNLEKLRENHEVAEVTAPASPVATPSPSVSVLPASVSSPSPSASSAEVETPKPVYTSFDTPSHSSGPLYILAPPPERKKPTPAPSVTETSAPDVAPVAAPTPSTSSSASASPTPGVSRKPDPLNSGADLFIKEIKHKVIFKALDNVLVKYQVDAKPVMKFVLKKDKILVLRATSTIKFQTSNSKSLLFKYNNRSEKLMGDDPQAVMKGKLMSLFFPPQLAETIDEPFPPDAAKVPSHEGAEPSPTGSSSPTP